MTHLPLFSENIYDVAGCMDYFRLNAIDSIKTVGMKLRLNTHAK
ncbi:MAG: hypothetical protein OT643_14240 [Bacteroidetes bacterium]|jgi:hypothetical protein|nr:hypothetical protein [Bacteroidota bacterium]